MLVFKVFSRNYVYVLFSPKIYQVKGLFVCLPVCPSGRRSLPPSWFTDHISAPPICWCSSLLSLHWFLYTNSQINVCICVCVYVPSHLNHLHPLTASFKCLCVYVPCEHPYCLCVLPQDIRMVCCCCLCWHCLPPQLLIFCMPYTTLLIQSFVFSVFSSVPNVVGIFENICEIVFLNSILSR